MAQTTASATSPTSSSILRRHNATTPSTARTARKMFAIACFATSAACAPVGSIMAAGFGPGARTIPAMAKIPWIIWFTSPV